MPEAEPENAQQNHFPRKSKEFAYAGQIRVNILYMSSSYNLATLNSKKTFKVLHSKVVNEFLLTCCY